MSFQPFINIFSLAHTQTMDKNKVTTYSILSLLRIFKRKKKKNEHKIDPTIRITADIQLDDEVYCIVYEDFKNFTTSFEEASN